MINYSFENHFQVIPQSNNTQKSRKEKFRPKDSIFEKRTQPKQKSEKQGIKNETKVGAQKETMHKETIKLYPTPGLTNQSDVLSMLYSRPHPPRYTAPPCDPHSIFAKSCSSVSDS